MHPVTGPRRLIAGRYRLVEPLGRGAMGIVWRGRDELLARDVAVKEVQLTARASPAEAEVLYQRTLREARTAARFSHPNVVTVFDVVEEDGSPWIVMELVEARSLDQVIAEDGPLPPERAAGLGAGLIGALATAHAAGVLHRDVKPSNVLVTGDGTAVLTDFGIATFAEDHGLTQAGMVVGTPGFTAPERVRGEVATPASDLWSLGATLYAAVEGRGPFDRAGGSTVITAGVASEDAPRAPSAGPLGPVIDALLSRDPAARPDSATAARLLADAAAAALTGPLPLQDALPAPGDDEAGQMGAEDSGFLDPPDYSVLSVPDSPSAPAQDEPAGQADLADAGGAVRSQAAASDPHGMPSAPRAADPAAPPVAAQPGRPGDDRLSTRATDPAAGQPGEAVLPWLASAVDAGGPASQADDAGSAAASRWTAAMDALRSSGRWRVILATTGIAAMVGAAFIGWSIFQHSGPASTVSDAVLPGQTAQAAGAVSSGSAARGSASHPASGQPAGSGPASGPSGHSRGTTPGASASGKASKSPAPSGSSSATASPSPSPSPSPPVLPAGYAWHQFSAAQLGSVAGFEIGMPTAWTQAISGQVARLIQPTRGFHLSVNVALWQYVTPLREAQYQESKASAAHKDQFRVLLLRTVNFQTLGGYVSAAAAELKYTWHNATLGTNVTQLDVLVTLTTNAGSQPYLFALEAPASTFGAADGVFKTALPTFRPMLP